MQDPTSRIRFSSVFPKKARIILRKTDPGPIWTAWHWSGFSQKHLVWSGSKPMCRNHRAQFLAGRNRSASSFPLSDPVIFFHRHPGSDCENPARIRFSSGCDCVRFGPNGSGPEASRSASNQPARFWPTLPIGSGTFIRHVDWGTLALRHWLSGLDWTRRAVYPLVVG